jgi:hypothetical protein
MQRALSNIIKLSFISVFVIIGITLISCCSSDYICIKVDRSALGPDAIEINRDSLIVGGYKIGSLAQRYYYKPAHLGGGGLSFYAFYIPPHLAKTDYGKYSVSAVENSKVTISAEGIQTGVDGINPIKAEFIVTKSSTSVSVFN